MLSTLKFHIDVWFQILAAPLHYFFRDYGWYLSFVEWAGDYSNPAVVIIILTTFIWFTCGSRDTLNLVFNKFIKFVKTHSRISFRRHTSNLNILKNKVYYFLSALALFFRK
jgi:hypothetical protein